MLLRPAHPEDALATARVHVRSWQAAYRTLLPDEYLDNLRPEDRAPHYDFATTDPTKPRTIVATEAPAILGFATTMPPHPANLPGYGELAALYVDPDHWQKGIGVQLISAARQALRQQGFTHALLWVLAGNLRADRFYRNDGWIPDGTRRTESLWNVTVEELLYRRPL
jgi:GNAT superfamily N-acetyltransferase